MSAGGCVEKRVLPSCAGLLLLATGAAGQGSAVLGQDNATFARKLYEIGYRDLAEKLCQVIAAKGASADQNELLEVRSLGFDFALEAARREPDLLKRKAAIQAVIVEKGEFIKGIARTRAAEYARASLPDDYRQLGETLTAILKDQKTDPATAAGLRQEGLQLFAEAEKELEERLERFDGERQETGSRAVYAARQYELAMFGLGQTYYFRSLLYAPEDPERKKVVKKAVGAFEDFGLEFPESLNAYVAAIYEGLCHRDNGDTRRALAAFDGALDLTKTYRPLDEGQFDVPADASDIISQAALQKVLLLKQAKRNDEADQAAEEFFRSIPDPWGTSHALPLAVARAEALVAAGKQDKAQEICNQVIERAPESPWANNARDLLAKFGSTGTMAPDQLLKIAQDQVVRGEFSRALQFCRNALVLARGTNEKDDIGAAAYDLIGIAYLRQARPLEAVIAFDAAAELFPSGKRAPELLYKAARLYLDLAAKEKRAFFRKRATDRMRQLATKYPGHPLAAKVVIADGQGLESDDKWNEAIEIYKNVPKDSPVHAEAQYRLGFCFYAQARQTKADANASAQAKKEAEGRIEEARTTLVRARATAEERAAETLDSAEQRELLDVAFNALSLEIQVLVDTHRGGETEALLAEGEQKYGADEGRRALIWGLRIQSLLEQRRFEEAIAVFEPLQLASPDAAGTTAAAFQLAIALDQAAAAEPGQARELWHKAAIYYQQSVRAVLEGRAPLDFERLDAVANRLLALGLHFNGVPETADTFVDWEGTPGAPELWQGAERMYVFMLSQGPSQRRQIQLARARGLLGRYEESADAYARIFDTTKVIVREGQQVRIDPQVTRNNPELIAAFLEYAVAEHRAGVASGEKNRMERAAQSIGDLVVALRNTSPDGRIFWQLKYAQARSLYDRGLYPDAKLLVEDIERTTNDFDQGKFGYKEKLLKLKEELLKKVPR